MVAQADPQLSRYFGRFSRFAGVVVLGVGLLVLSGWILDVPALKGVIPGFVTMKFNTALCFALGSLALLLQQESGQPRQHRIAQCCAIVVALMGLLTFSEYLLGWNLGVDQWLVHEPASALQAIYPGRMAPITALDFLLLGSALFIFEHRYGYWFAQGLELAAILFSMLAVVGYLYGVEALYRVSIFTSIAPTTAITLFVLCLGVLLIRTGRGLTAVLVTPTAGGVMARRLLPISIGLPIVVGWFALQGVHAGIYDSAFSTSAVALSSIVVFTALIWLNANSVHRIDIALRQSRDDLEDRVQERTADLSAANLRLENEVLQRQQAERVLAAERNLLRTLIDNVPDYIFAKDLAGRFVISNLAHARAAHVDSPEELVGKTAFEVFPSEFAAQFHADDLAIMESGQPMINLERMTLDDKGNQRSVLTSKVPLRDSTGNVIGLVGISHDISERQRVEQALRESETRLAGILETAHEAVISVDEEQHIILYNTGAEMAFGYSRDEAIGQPLDLLLPDWARAIHPKHVRDFAIELDIARRMAERREVYGRRKNGDEFPAEASISKLKMEGHHVFTVVLRDVTERKQAEAALRMSEAAEHEQRVLAETLRDTALALTRAIDPAEVMNNILVNIARVVPHDAADIMLIEWGTIHLVAWRGYPPEVAATFDQIDLSMNTPTLQKMMTTRSPVLIPDTDADPDWLKMPGSAWMRSYLSAPIEIGGQVVGFLNLNSNQPGFFTSVHAQQLHAFAAQAGIAIDNARLIEELQRYATELEQRVEERTLELQRAKEHVEAILNHSSDAILVIGADGEILQVNPTFSDLFGYPPDQVLGQLLTALVEPNYVDRMKAIFSSVATASSSSRLEVEAHRQDGTIFNADVGVSLIMRQPAGGPPGDQPELVCSIRDITDRKRVERELQDMNRLKTEFLSTAAHELRTPLTSILGFSELLLSRDLDEGRRLRYLQLIHEQSVQLHKIIAALLDISRLETKQGLALDTRQVKVQDLINQVLAHFAELAPKHRFHCEGLSACPSILGDPFRLSQVFQNLVSNAVKYSPEGGTVVVRGQSVPGLIELSVQDEGIGMTPQQQSHLFERFYRADASNTTISGTGLGLAISKLIVELHGGRIWVESEYGVGTVVHIALPLPASETSQGTIGG